MTTIVTTSGITDMSEWDVGNLKDGKITTHTSTKFVITNSPDSFTFTGSFSNYNSKNVPQSGTITGAVLKTDVGVTTITDAHLSVADFIHQVQTDDAMGFANELMAGKDTVSGGKGADKIGGLGNADMLTGGKGNDTFLYVQASDSTGKTYDTITDFNGSGDRIDAPSKVTAIDMAIVKGALTTAKFDAQLTAATASLGKHHAVEFTASTGNLKGEHFLVVDLNGKVGYQSGADMVIHLGDDSVNLDHLSKNSFV